MKGSDRLILLVIPMVVLAIGFWLLVLSPKQREADELQTRIDAATASITAAEAQVRVAEAARRAFPRNYANLIELGTAVPEDDDQATLIYDLAELGDRNSVHFRSLVLTDAGAASAPATPPPTAAVTPTATEPPPSDPAAVPTAATEASAATLPIGAEVGPAGLPITPYDFKFLGSFSDMADFFADLDRRIVTPAEEVDPDVRGRLMTIDGFALTGDPVKGFPDVEANFNVTTYIVPAEQGIGAGATPAGPAPVGSPAAPVPISADGTVAPTGTSAAVAP